MMKKILLKISGSIAAYKVCHLISRLTQAGHQVRVAVSPHALHFIGESTLEGLSQNPIHKDTFTTQQAMDHIHLMRWADLILAAPATANYINKIAHGVGDDLLTTLFLAHDFNKPYLLAPAMNTAMYLHPITQNSLKKLRDLNIEILETESGVLACGEVGWGRLLEPELILKKLESVLNLDSVLQLETKKNPASTPKAVLPYKVLISSGGTQEPIDSMRVISNLSTGKTGVGLADFLYQLGFHVTLLKAKNSLALPRFPYTTEEFVTSQDLSILLKNYLNNENFDAVVQAAAVSDFTVDSQDTYSLSNTKIKSNQEYHLKLKPTAKILPHLKSWSRNPSIKVIGFKYTASRILEDRKLAVQKLFDDAKVNAVIHNDHFDIDRSKKIHPFTFYTTLENRLHPTPCSSPLSIYQCLTDFLIQGETQ